MAMFEAKGKRPPTESVNTLDPDLRVAILVPTLNRSDFLTRTLEYYESIQSGHVIYIGDASATEDTHTIKKIISNLSIQVRYFNWPKLGTNATITRLAKEAKLDKIKFCAIQGDDDFLIVDSLWKASKFLAENPDYRTAQGRAALFTLDRDGAVGNIDVLGDYWDKPELTSDSPVLRFRKFSQEYFVLQFSTHRTHEFLESSRIYNEIHNDMLGELTHCYTFALVGRSKFIDCLYLVRHSHPGAKHPYLIDRIMDPSWSDDLQKMFNSISQILSESGLIDAYSAKAEVQALFIRYFSCLTKRQYSAKRIKSTIRFFAGTLLHRIKRKVVGFYCDKQSSHCLDMKRSHYYLDFKPILDVLSDEKIGPHVK
jgi:glycosyltransferase domain-containing protein